uniref:Uncharacterized protein n=1 Tax=Oryza barthii TaxID=65489 RepID=A0A0D3F9J4_9ORYZ
MHIPRLPLLLKIAAATAAGALALIVAAGLRRDDAVASLRREIRDAVAALVASNEDGVVEGEGEGEDAAEAPAPSVLITGFRAHGKSSLTKPWATRADIDAAISGGNPECVVLALRCDAPAKERNAAVKRLPEISAAVRAKGLNLIVVLTFKKAMRSARQAEELIREVSFRARTDCVYFIENYTWNNNGPNLRHPPVIKNDFETHFTVLTIIRQCLEFIKLNRSQSKREENGEKGNSGDVKGTLEKVLTANAKSSGELSVKPALEKVLTANAKSSGELSVKPADVKPVLTVQ